MKISAVLTADVVNSSYLSGSVMERLIQALKEELKEGTPPVHFYRGDGFNLLVPPEKALLTAARLRAISKTFQPAELQEDIDIRIAIGLGHVEEPVLSMANGVGEAFNLSGRELDIITKNSRRLAIRCSDIEAETGFRAVILYADYILSRLTPKQAEVVLGLLRGSNEKEIALQLHKKQPTVNKLKRAALWDEFEQLIQLYQELLSIMNQKD